MKNAQAVIVLTTSMLMTGAYAEVFGAGSNQFTIDFVSINNANNVADATGYGSVGYDYRIGTYEITIDQFTKARAADNRIGSGDEDYWNSGARTVGTAAPAVYSSWLECAKFANWLTTGDAYTGAYQFDNGGVLTAVDRNAAVNTYGTVYVLPTEDEWYKAAYYKPVNDGSYSIYANGSDDVADLIHGTSTGWNYYDDGYVNGSPNYMWETGYGGAEQNGTHDMMGNVGEWTESAFDGTLDNLTENRVVRGSTAHRTEDTLRSSWRVQNYSPSTTSLNIGFRVAAIPEPSSIAMIGLVSGCAIFVRRIFLI